MLHGIQSATQIKALLSAMLAFALKGCDTSNESDAAHIDGNGSSSHFRGLALKLMDQAISECEDEPLPLPLLQALILITHGLLIQGVRARAWRYLGICVRSAYESNLHLVDSGKSPEDNTPDHVVDPARWCEDEERRRAWWAIWEMDVFASVIRRCPTAIDWSQNETFLPAEDERWARGEPQPSCMLKTGLVDRWKALQATGNQSPKAWFIVINSLMKDAQKISSPVGVDKAPDQRMSTGGNTTRDKSRKLDTSHTKDARNRLSAMQNSLYCTVMALPRTLKYEYQSIHFGTRDADPEQRSSIRLLHSSIYSIHVMVQLTKLMIYKYHIFRMDPMWPRPTSESGIPAGRSEDAATAPRPIGDHSSIEYQSLYFEAADEVMRIVRRSSPDQHKYVNPFLANSIWVAAAVQLLHRELVPVSSSNKERINSNFALLCMTYNQFVDYWSVSTTPQKTLDILEKELKRFEHDHHNGFWSTDGKSSRVVGDIGHNPATSRGEINADLVNSHVPLSAPDSTCDGELMFLPAVPTRGNLRPFSPHQSWPGCTNTSADSSCKSAPQ